MESEPFDVNQVEALLAFADALPSPAPSLSTPANHGLRLRKNKWIRRHGLSASADFVVIVQLDSCALAKQYEQWLLHSLLFMRDYSLQDTQDRPSRTFRVLFGPCSCRKDDKSCPHPCRPPPRKHMVRAIVHLEPRPGYVLSEDQLSIIIDRPPLSYHTHASLPLSVELAKFLPDLSIPTPDFVQELGLSAVSAYTAHHIWCEIKNTLAPQIACMWQYRYAKWHSTPLVDTVRFAHWNYPIQRMPTPTHYIPDPFVPHIDPPIGLVVDPPIGSVVDPPIGLVKHDPPVGLDETEKINTRDRELVTQGDIEMGIIHLD